MKNVPLLFLAILVSPAVLVAQADHGVGRCASGDNISLGIIQVGDGTAERTLYIDDRNYLLGQGIWIYAETNGVFSPKPRGELGPTVIHHWWTLGYGDAHDNLQHGGEALWTSALPEEHRYGEVCSDMGDWAPDTLIY